LIDAMHQSKVFRYPPSDDMSPDRDQSGVGSRPTAHDERLRLDESAAELVAHVKLAAILPFDKMQPELQETWRKLAQAMKNLP